MSDKTEQPTAKRLTKAREEGDSGASSFASQALAFLVVILLVPAAVRAVASSSADGLRGAMARAASRNPSIAVDAGALAVEFLTLVLPLLLAAALVGAAASLVQTGAFFATKKLSPKLERLNAFEGFKRLFSVDRLFSVARSLLGGAAVAWLAYHGLRTHAADLARASGRLAYVGVVASGVAYEMAKDAALLGLALAAFDVAIVRRGWMKRLMMTKDEVKREYKESEGDPQMKAARERAHHELLASATIANVRNASVVIVNPTHLACALRYDEKEGDAAPVVVATGEGDMAAQIVKAAQDFGVPILRDVPLARALRELEVGDAIPEALYEAVAEILRDAWDEGAVAK